MVLPTRTFQTIPGSPVTTIEGSNASDVLGGVNISKNLRINGKDGYDQLTLAAKKASALTAISVYGNAGNDIITTASTITGSLIQGGGDGDVIRVSSATTEVTVRGGSENDQISGLIGGTKLILNGNKGYDTLRVAGTFINSSIHGGDSDDKIIISSGILDATHIKGDKGNDTITDDGVANDLTFRNGSKICGDVGNDLITMIAATKSVVAQGDSGNDTLIGGTGADKLNGGADNDLITGGNDTALDNLQGGEGLDTFNIGAGWFLAGETIDGGDGIDTLRFTGSLSMADAVNDTHFTNKTNLERIQLDNANNSLTLGTNAAASFFNSSIPCSILCGTRNDNINATAYTESIVIFGLDGIDNITGGDGNDGLYGGDGADVLDGNAGADVLTGNLQADNFVYGAVADSASAVDGTAKTFDTITDFTTGSDKILVAGINTELTGGQAATGATVTILTTANNSLNDTTIADFAELKVAVDAKGLVGSAAGAAGGNTGLQAYIIDLTGNTGDLGTGKYLVLNNNNTNLSALDVMIQLTSGSVAAGDFSFAP